MSAQRIFHSPNLLQIALPMGGIGAGCICLNGYGGLQDFSIRNAPATSASADRHQPSDAGFALLHLPGEGITRLVEGPFPPEKIFNLGLRSQGYNGGGYEGLPRFRGCSFRGEYPFGVVELSDSEIPLEVTIIGFSPFVPLDDIASGLPCAILEYTLRSTSEKPLPYQFSYHLSHLAQKGIQTQALSRAIPGEGVKFFNAEPHDSEFFGSAAMSILAGEPKIKARWFQGGWFDAVSALWREVSTGKFQANVELPDGSPHARSGGSMLVEGVLAPGEHCTYPVVIAWHFPNIADPTRTGCDGSCSSAWHPFYTTRWKDAVDVQDYVRTNYPSLRSRTQAFHDALFSSSLPDEVLDAVSANLAVLKSPTVLRHDSGDIWAWEGCFCDSGCCPGSCTHVWNYAQAMPHLFPALERTLRRRELEDSMDERGHINFRAAPPGHDTAHNFHAAADGQLGGIMKLYREWQISGDSAWLARMYPLAKRSMDFCIEQWDPRRRGLIEEPHHNTYDIEFWGPDGMCSSFYLGALAAMSALAIDAGFPEDAEDYKRLANIGARHIDDELFNDEYYQQKVQVEGLRDTGFVDRLSSLSDDLSEEEFLLKVEGPKYQYGAGCLSDGVFGVWLAELCGVQSPQNRNNIRQHLQSVFRYNFKASLSEHANVQRPGYALGDEAGLLLCTWPRGGKPTLPFVYCDEVWTGIEYQVASHLISEGFVQEGLAIVNATRSRYDGRTRNPWNEYECGSYYARAMSSYALLIACSGFRYSAVNNTLYLAPKIEESFSCFFSTAAAWGQLKLSENMLQIAVQEGELVVEHLHLRLKGQTYHLHPHQVARAGTLCEIWLDAATPAS
jgi:uncharacterized protein (DUF608 family)